MQITPIIVYGPGRCGSTLVMQLLGTAKEIAIPQTPPFEDRYILYLYTLATFTAKEDAPHLVSALMQQRPVLTQSMGFPLYHGFNYGDFMDHEFFKKELQTALNQSFCNAVKHKHPDALYYAEKSMGGKHPLDNAKIPHKGLYLVRDPRDIVCSVMAFNQKRKFNGFAWLKEDTAYSYSERMIPMYKRTLSWISFNDSDKLTVKYEDLALRLEAASDTLAKWLGVGFTPEAVARRQTNFKDHMTSVNSQESVNKWQKQFDKKTIELFKKELGPALEKCGYVV